MKRLIDTDLPNGAIGYTCDQTTKASDISADDLFCTEADAVADAKEHTEDCCYNPQTVRRFRFVESKNRFTELDYSILHQFSAHTGRITGLFDSEGKHLRTYHGTISLDTAMRMYEAEEAAMLEDDKRVHDALCMCVECMGHSTVK